MTKRKLNFKRVLVVLFLLFLILVCAGVGVFFYELSPVDKNSEEVTYEVKSGMTVNEIFDDMESKGIIRSALFMRLYSKFVGGINVEAGSYVISSSMSSREIRDVLKEGGKSSRETFTITFKEGKNVRDLALLLENTTNKRITKEEFINKLKDEDYLKELINKYWFLTSDILDDDIYYSLEGYLFPNTYEIYKDASVEEVITKMLDETLRQLNKIKEEIEDSNYSVHELLTLASIVELESNNKNDRDDISGVFTNRLNDGWALESCVSTFYAFDINMGDRDLRTSEIEDCSTKYNTRCKTFTGLPIGPIGNPGTESIIATLNPSEHDYYFFQSDKNMKTYFAKTYSEHVSINNRLKNEGLWLEY